MTDLAIYNRRLRNWDGSTSTVAEIVAAMLEAGTDRRLVDAWVIGLDQQKDPTMIIDAERRSAMHDLETSAGQLACEASRVNAPNNDKLLKLWLSACVRSASQMGVEPEPPSLDFLGSYPSRIADPEHAWAEAILWEIDHLAAKLYDCIGTNDQDDNANELLDEYNRYVEIRCPFGHRGFPF